MKLPPDIHVLPWRLDDHPRLGSLTRRHIADRSHQVYYSAAGIREASIKEAKGKLKISRDFDEKLAGEPLLSLPVSHYHARRSALLPPIHKDPFDRLLVAQCLIEGMTLVTEDDTPAKYDVPTIAA